MYDYKTHNLPNGLKILTMPSKKNKLVTLQLIFKLGNDVETTNRLLELTHFMEHLFCLFTSTKYPNGKENREYISNNNIDLDAEVVNKHILFSLEFKNKHIEKVFDMVCHALTDFRVDKNLFPQEKNAVIEELNDFIKEPDYKFERKIDGILFKGHQREKSTEMRIDNCKKTKVSDLSKYYKKYFTPRNYVVGVHGNFDNKSILFLKKNMSGLTGRGYKYSTFSYTNKTNLVFVNKESKISNLRIYFKVPYILFDEESYSIDALIDILSNDLNSLFLKKLRTEKGLIYDLDMGSELDEIDKNLSIIEISTSCNTSNVLKVLEYILEILYAVKNKFIDETEIKKYKEQCNISYIKDKASPSPIDILNSYCNYLLWDHKIITYEEEYKKTIDIDKHKLIQTAKNIFNFDNMVVCYDSQNNLDSKIYSIINNITQC